MEIQTRLLTQQEVNEAFINANLEEDYNFLQDDLMKLADAFIRAAKPKIAQQERDECVEVARSVNHLVAERIEQVRSKS
jgi:hypothetical protein